MKLETTSGDYTVEAAVFHVYCLSTVKDMAAVANVRGKLDKSMMRSLEADLVWGRQVLS